VRPAISRSIAAGAKRRVCEMLPSLLSGLVKKRCKRSGNFVERRGQCGPPARSCRLRQRNFRRPHKPFTADAAAKDCCFRQLSGFPQIHSAHHNNKEYSVAGSGKINCWLLNL